MKMFFFRVYDDGGDIHSASFRPLSQSELGVKIIGETNDIPADYRLVIDTFPVTGWINGILDFNAVQARVTNANDGEVWYRMDSETFYTITDGVLTLFVPVAPVIEFP